MAKKYKGFKNKAIARVASIVVSAGMIVGTVIGANIYTRDNFRPTLDKPDPLSSNSVTRPTHTLAPEPPILTEPNVGTEITPEYSYTSQDPALTSPNSSRPTHDLMPEPPILNDTDKNPEQTTHVTTPIAQSLTPESSTLQTEPSIEPSEDCVEVLATLTSLFKDKVYSTTGKEPNLTVVSLNDIIVKDGKVALYGDIKLNNKINSYVASMDCIREFYYYLTGNSEQEFISAFNKLLNSTESINLSLQLKHNFTLDNQTQIITNLLNKQIEQLSFDADNTAQVEYIKNLLKNPDSLNLYTLDANSFKNQNGTYTNTFSTLIKNDKFSYYAEHSFESNAELKQASLKAGIEQYLLDSLSNSYTYVSPNNVIDTAIDSINTKTNNLQTESSNTLGK